MLVRNSQAVICSKQTQSFTLLLKLNYNIFLWKPICVHWAFQICPAGKRTQAVLLEAKCRTGSPHLLGVNPGGQLSTTQLLAPCPVGEGKRKGRVKAGKLCASTPGQLFIGHPSTWKQTAACALLLKWWRRRRWQYSLWHTAWLPWTPRLSS